MDGLATSGLGMKTIGNTRGVWIGMKTTENNHSVRIRDENYSPGMLIRDENDPKQSSCMLIRDENDPKQSSWGVD